MKSYYNYTDYEKDLIDAEAYKRARAAHSISKSNTWYLREEKGDASPVMRKNGIIEVFKWLILGSLTILVLGSLIWGLILWDHHANLDEYAGSLEPGEAQEHATRTMFNQYGANAYGWVQVGEPHRDRLLGIGAWRIDYRHDVSKKKRCVFVWFGKAPQEGREQRLSIVRRGPACGG